MLGCSGTPKHPNWKNATGAEQYERLMWEAIRDKNWKELERHLAPTFVGVAPDGKVCDRAGWLAQWQSSQLMAFSLAETQVQPEGADMVVSYVVNSDYANGSRAPAMWRVVSVWQDVKTRWVLISTALVPVAPAKS